MPGSDHEKVEVTLFQGPTLGIRHVQVVLLFFCIVVNYIGRLNVSVAIVAMTNSQTTNPDFQEFNWSEKEKSYILSSFYWGYVCTQFLGAYLCRAFGAKWIILLSTTGSSLLTLAIPVSIAWGGWSAYCVIRTFQGLLQGFFYPCIYDHLAKWCPVEERTRLGALSHTGIEIGTILAMTSTGFIAESEIGWPGISYVSGGLGLVWGILWLAFAENTPSTSKYISTKEKLYILMSQQHSDTADKEKLPIPWKSIFTSTPFLSLVIVRIAEAWGFTTIQAEIPLYLRGVLDMNIRNNALFSGLPFLAMFIMSNVYIVVSDVLIRKQIVTLTSLRKIVNSVAMWTPSAALIGVGFLEKNQIPLAIGLITIAIGFNGGVTVGSILNAIDLSSNHVAILMGIINTITSCVSMTTPLCVGIIVQDQGNSGQWQFVFAIASVVFFFGNLQYIFLCSTKEQVWNRDTLFQNNFQSKKRKCSVIHPRLEKYTESVEKTVGVHIIYVN